MHNQIDPTDFAKVMSLPATVRHDLLEFLGSTPMAPAETGQLIRRFLARTGVLLSQPVST